MAVALSLLASLAAAEIGLRIAGFSFELKAHLVEAQAPKRAEVHKGYVVDDDLLWTRRNYRQVLEWSLTHYPDIIFMGDSCTEFGDYDKRLARLIESSPGSLKIRYANFGCAGWSTFQGRRQMRRDVVRLRPRVVTIYYGWNDHWPSIGLDDAQVARLNRTPLFRLRGLKLAQLVTKVAVALARKRNVYLPRVSMEDFRENLNEIVLTARDAGAVPVLLTAPTPGRENEGRWVGDLSSLPALHRHYADVVREVARNERAVLCDLAAEFDRIPADVLRSTYFYRDEVHLTPEGNLKVAEILLDCLQKGDLLRISR